MSSRPLQAQFCVAAQGASDAEGGTAMSMEIHCLSDRQLDSIIDWQQAIDAQGFALKLSNSCPFASLKGFLPAQSGETETGFECYHDDPDELLVEYDNIDFGHSWKFALSFRWGGDLSECLAAYMAAAAYAKATDGVVFDSEEGQILTPQKAVECARQMETELPAVQAELDRIRARSDE
jgi:hypothetical protein